MNNSLDFDLNRVSELTIKELKNKCSNLELKQELISVIKVLKKDSRKGVQKIAAKLERKIAKKEAIVTKWEKMQQLEKEYSQKGYQVIIGIDEAGRGPLAGPVVAAAVLLDPQNKIYGLDDSKKLNLAKRENLFKQIKAKAKVGIGQATSSEIDKYNIREATFTAMKRAVKDLLPKLKKQPDLLLIDGNAVIPGLTVEQESIIDGDAKVNNIAAASIIAKVSRDKLIYKYAEEFPEYNLESNKGYGTAEHIAALKKYGSTPIHRKSFARVPD
ncbi:MAG: ribonuclease HII [Bacillota bacterium]